MANGERIGLSGHTRILFEVDSLMNASPATVSRCAMIYLDPLDLGYMPFLNYWFRCKLPNALPKNAIDFLRELMDFSLDKGIKSLFLSLIFLFFFFDNNKFFIGFTFLSGLKDPWHVPVTKLNILQTLCYLLSTFLNYLDKHGGFGEDDQRIAVTSASMNFFLNIEQNCNDQSVSIKVFYTYFIL